MDRTPASTWRVHLVRAAAGWSAVPRRRPLLVLALLLTGLVAVSVTSDPPRAVLPTVLQVLPLLQVCLLAATRPHRISVPAAAVTTLVEAPCAAVLDEHSPPFGGPPAVVSIVAVTVIAWLIGHTIRQNHLHAETLRAHAATNERLRLARDLHDMVAHSIGVIAIQAGMANRVIDAKPDEARKAMQAIETTSRQTLAGLRQMLTTLRHADPAAHDDAPPLPPTPGLADLDRLMAATRDTGIRVDVRWHGRRRRLPLDTDTCAFRIIQEALTNVIRHAHASHGEVHIDYHDTDLSIEVTDDGRGGAVGDTGYGITGMRERAALLGGQLTAAPRADGGFQVTAQLPIPAATPPSHP
jgi:signal transduction histidine kinase